MSFFKELKRRNVFRVLLAYAVAGWVLVEAMELLTGIFEAPDWVMKVFVGAVFIGFLPVMIFSWVYEITPEGIRKESSDKPEHSAASSKKLDVAVLVMLTVAIGLVGYDRFAGDAQTTPAPVSAPAPEETQVAVSEGPPMVAVLPFVTASLEGESEFFATGVHDDLLTQLAQLQSIRVISRTSVLEYKDTVKNIREIGKALGADAILEGGVQSAGNRIRINAQLIDAKTDEHLWAQTYDRELLPANIFDVQTEIARAITSALKTTLTDQDSMQLAVIPTENMAAYRAYHEAMNIRDSVGPMSDTGYLEKLEEAVNLDPGFTRAWAELAGNLSYRTFFSDDEPELIGRAEQVLEKIHTLAPNSADDYIAQAYFTYYTLRDYDRAAQLISQAHVLMPSDIRLLELKTWIQRRQGDFTGRIETFRLISQLDPRNPRFTAAVIGNLMLIHRYDEAQQETETLTIEKYEFAYWRTALQARDHLDIRKFATDWLAIQQKFEDKVTPQNQWEAHIANRDFASADKSWSSIPERPDDESDPSADISHRRAFQIITYWMQQRGELLTELLEQTRVEIEPARNSSNDYDILDFYFNSALLAAAGGDTEETSRLIRRWQSGMTSLDLAELANLRTYACQALGMAAATVAAVECLRSSFTEPSWAMPFIEPYLPYYDPIRKQAAFVELLDELRQSQ